jgi:diguanylate cyclase (GGDEF)-like protein
MDYGTFFITNIASVTVFAICIGLMAWFNPRVAGMRWFAGAMAVGWLKLILQALEGHAPVLLTGMMANELYLISFVMQFMGLRWFVRRRAKSSANIWIAIGAVLAVYTVTFFAKVPYTANVMNVPFIGTCIGATWMLAKHGRHPFTGIARVTAVVTLLQGGVALYRALLTNFCYPEPWQTVLAHNDPRWTYSLAGAAMLASFMGMCELWFLVIELHRELAEQARTDPLTGAINRRAMEELAVAEAARSHRSGHALSMVMLDIDNFKHLNDSYGHAAGDRALQMLVRHLKLSLRLQDALARTGGEEFAILLPDTNEIDALAIAERARQIVEKLDIRFEHKIIHITICAGVALLDPCRSWECMMRAADTAMYEAKKHGRNLVSARFSKNEADSQLGKSFDLSECRYVQMAANSA